LQAAHAFEFLLRGRDESKEKELNELKAAYESQRSAYAALENSYQGIRTSLEKEEAKYASSLDYVACTRKENERFKEEVASLKETILRMEADLPAKLKDATQKGINLAGERYGKKFKEAEVTIWNAALAAARYPAGGPAYKKVPGAGTSGEQS
jgi:hypothetical protein